MGFLGKGSKVRNTEQRTMSHEKNKLKSNNFFNLYDNKNNFQWI